MILSHKHRFIYIKTYKTASTSIEAALSEVCGSDDVITPASEPLMKHRKEARAQNYRLKHPLVPKRPLWRRLLLRPERRYHPSIGYYEHMPAWRVKAYVGDEIWESYYKFSFERNPWDRQVSWYHYKTKSKSPRPNFDAFNADKTRAYVENYGLYEVDGEVALAAIGTYENLAGDFQTIMKTIGLDGKVSLPHVNVSTGPRGRHYREFYDDKSRALIAEWYAREIALFSYTF